MTQRLCRITVPGFSVKRDFTAARTRLLQAFPEVDEVMATTAPGTLLVLSAGIEDVDGWVEVLLDLRPGKRAQIPARARPWRSPRGGDTAA